MNAFRSLEIDWLVISPAKIVYSNQDSWFFGQCEQTHDVIIVVTVVVVINVVVVIVVFTLTSFILGLSFRNSLSPRSPLMMAENSENVA